MLGKKGKDGHSASPVLIIVFLVSALIALGSLAGLFFLSHKISELSQKAGGEKGYDGKPPIEEEKEAPSRRMGPVLSLEPIVLNINHGKEIRHVRITIVFETADEAALKKLEEARSKIVDRLIDYLPTRQALDFYNKEIRAIIKRDIAESVNAILGKNLVVNVYISGFVFQGY
jgi:flagellar basal body-associated protein FliL